MVIKTAEDKCSDIHSNYRNMANELHAAWAYKYGKLKKENERLLDTLTFLQKQMQTNNEQTEQKENIKAEETPDLTSIPIENLAESLDLDDDELNQLTGGNIQSSTTKEKLIEVNRNAKHFSSNVCMPGWEPYVD